MPIPKFIGARIKRREDPALIQGQGRFVGDIPLEQPLHMVLLRSPYAHARFGRIDASAARQMSGVVAVLTAEELEPFILKPLPSKAEAVAGTYSEVRIPEYRVLAGNKVRYAGEPLAVVLAEDPYTAADAVEAVTVEYDPLPAVADLEAALSSEAEPIHEQWIDNRAFTWTVEGGAVDECFAQAEVVVELKARIQRLISNPMEPRTVAARFELETESFTLWSSTQAPHLLRDDLAEILGVSSERVRVIAPEVGGGFGAKSNTYPEEVLALVAARMFHRPVRWNASRTEDFLVTNHGRGQVDVLRLAADRTGRLLGIDLEVMADAGAYFTKALPIVPTLTGVMIPGVYDVANVRAHVVGVFTNKTPSEPYRGAGRPEAAYLIERAMDTLARELEIDPAEIRRRNFIPPEHFPYKTGTGLEYDSGQYLRSLESALESIGYAGIREEQSARRNGDGPLLGVGISCYVEICGFGPWEAGAVAVEKDGSVVVKTGTSPHGQGHVTSWCQLAAETLQVPMERVRVLHGDTQVVREGIGTFGSRSAAVGGAAILESSQKVFEGARTIAAHLLEAAPDDMTAEEGQFFVLGVPGRSVTWEEVAQAAYSPDLPDELKGLLSDERRFETSGETYPFGTHICVVEVDRHTGQVRIERYLTVDDCGAVINPLLVEGQIHGGIAQGVGQALFEEAIHDAQGNLVTGSLMDYALPRAHLIPSFETSRTETPTSLNPLGVKGVGEAATIGSTPAVVNAVVDALAHLGVRHIDTPLKAEKIWNLLNLSGEAIKGPKSTV